MVRIRIRLVVCLLLRLAWRWTSVIIYDVSITQVYVRCNEIKRKGAIIITQTSQARAILRNLHALNERRYVGDTNASDTLVDFADAVKRARLTARQSEALRLVYVEDLTQKVAGERMGVGQDVVSTHLDASIEKIDAVYGVWEQLETEAVG